MVLFVPVLAVLAAVEEEPADPVLDFYCSRAGSVCRSRSPFENGTSFSLATRTYLTKLKRGGKTELLDSAFVTYFISFDAVDSQHVVVSTSKKLTDIDFSYPDIFLSDYDFYFYPNDTGGALIAIGFDCDTTSQLNPVGLAVINRNEYFLKRLYLYYPNVKRLKQYSRYLSFTEYEGLIVPDTIRDTYTKAGIISVDHYRRETFIDSIHVYR